MEKSVTPEGLSKKGKASYHRQEYLEAAEEYLAAATGYDLKGDQITAAEMRNNAGVAYLQADNPLAALELVQGTPQIFAENGDVKREGMAWGNLGSALEGLERFDEAIEAYIKSAELLQQAGESNARLRVIQSLSALQLRTGKRIQALATMQAGLNGLEKPTLKQKMLKKLLQMPFDLMNR